MRMEAGGSVDQGRASHHRDHHVSYMRNRVIRKRKYYSNKNKKLKHPSYLSSSDSALQRLFLSCKDVFKGLENGTLPSPQHVRQLSSILNTVAPQDVGLRNDMHFFNPEKRNLEEFETPRVTYTTIYKCNDFSVCCFFIPANAVIPLHNHPGMTVFSKLLLGNMHIKSYDLVSIDPVRNAHGKEFRLAKLKADGVFSAPCNASVLYPTTGGNIHAFTAITPCAVLDVLGPPYSKQDGRDCSYYKDHLFSCDVACSNAAVAKEGDEGHYYSWLEEIEAPHDAEMDGIEYLGPQIIDTI